MKMLEKFANLSHYADPLLVGVAPRTVQERRMMSKRKLVGAGIGAGLGAGLAVLDKKTSPTYSQKRTLGQTMRDLAVFGGIGGAVIGNYSAHKAIADKRRREGSEVYLKDDIERTPLLQVDGYLSPL